MNGDELSALEDAERAMGLSVAGEVLKDMPGRRRIVRYGDVVVKAFSLSEADAAAREAVGLAAAQQCGLAPILLRANERWVATRFVAGLQIDSSLGEFATHRALGGALAKLHAVRPTELEPWSVVSRLIARLDDPPPACSPQLAHDIGSLTADWLSLMGSDTFVHGDWGTSNVLVDLNDSERIIILDFEDAHLGDPAEDFRWQGLAGPTSPQLTSMLAGYTRPLGPHLAERITVATAELCLDVLRWDVPSTSHDRCLATLQALVDGWRPGL